MTNAKMAEEIKSSDKLINLQNNDVDTNKIVNKNTQVILMCCIFDCV